MLTRENTMKTERIYEGKMVNLRIDTVELPNRKYSKREIVEHPGAVGIIPITEDGKIVLVKQYRKAVERFLYEIPAGKLEINEEPRETAKRELKEETGYDVGELEYLLEFFPSAGITTEKIHLFKATELTSGELVLDDGEFLEVLEVTFDEMDRMISIGDIVDGKTLIAFLTIKEAYKNEKKGE